MPIAARWALVVLLSSAFQSGAGGAEPRPFGGTCLERLPALAVQDQDARWQDFRSEVLEGHLVAVNFVFTRCQGICPVLGAQFAELERALHDAGTGVQLLSISLDPGYDSAERLAQWGERLGRKSGWTLLTGEVESVQRLLRALGMGAGDPWSHAPVTWLIDARQPGAPPRCERLAGLRTPSELTDLLTTRWEHPPR